MRIKLDENLPIRAAQPLRDMGHDVDTALDEGLGGASDGTVWKTTQAEGRFLITQDLDFSDARQFAPGTHHGILLVRLDDLEQPQIAEYLRAWFSMAQAESWAGAFVVASARKIRVVRPDREPSS